MHASAERWNRKYRAARGPRRFDIEPRLQRCAHLLGAPGRGLEIACGTAAHSLWLVARGWRMTGLDVSVEGLRIARAEARRRGLAMQYVVGDALRLPLAPATRFELIVVVRFLERELFPWIHAALAPGGRLFYATFHEGRLVRHPEFNPRFVLARGELAAAFSNLDALAGGEDDESSWVLATRAWAAE